MSITIFTPYAFSTKKPSMIVDTIVLDMDQTLIYSRSAHEKPKAMTSPNRISSFQACGYDVAERPGLVPFLRELRRSFSNVIVWSAGERTYVESIISHIFNKAGYQPTLIWARENCVQVGSSYTKPLYKLVESGHITNIAQAILIDDLPLSHSPNVDNGVLIPEFEGRDDDCLLVLTRWIKTNKTITLDSVAEINSLFRRR